MIRNEAEYREALRRVQAGRDQLVEYEAMLKQEGLAPDEVARGVALLASFHKQLEDEVAGYERLRRGDLRQYQDIRSIGVLLIAARIARGLSQRDLAKKLGVHESQVSRDERNEYRRVSFERVSQILDAIGVDVRLRAEVRSGVASAADVVPVPPISFDVPAPKPVRAKVVVEVSPDLESRSNHLPSAA